MVCSQLGHSRRGNPRPNAARPAVREHLAEDSTPISCSRVAPYLLWRRGTVARRVALTPRDYSDGIDFFRYPVRGRNAQWRRIRSQAARQGIVLRSKGARDSIPVQPRIKIMRGPTHVGARVSFDLEIYRRLLAAIALDLIFNGLSFVE